MLLNAWAEALEWRVFVPRGIQVIIFILNFYYSNRCVCLFLRVGQIQQDRSANFAKISVACKYINTILQKYKNKNNLYLKVAVKCKKYHFLVFELLRGVKNLSIIITPFHLSHLIYCMFFFCQESLKALRMRYRVL